MANRDMKLSLLLSLKDNMSNGLVRALKSVTDGGKQAESSLKKAADAAMQAKPTALEQVGRAAKNVDQSGKQAATSLDKLAAAANKPRTSAIDKVATSLKNVRSVAAATLDTINGVARAGAQVAAGGYVLSAASKRPMDYGRQLAFLSNTAYSDQDTAGRIAGQQGLHDAIKKAVRDYGGSPETAAAALSSLSGSGAFGDAKSSVNHLPGVLQAGTAADTDREQLIQILNSAKQSMNLDDDKAIFSKAIKGGQLGGFELKDMSRYLPEQMSKMASLGMGNQAGYESLIAANQAVRIVSGTPEAAATNLINLLDKAASQDTIKDFEKQGINLTGSLAKARAAGANTLEAFVNAVEDVAGKDKHLKQALLKVKKAKSEDRKQALEGAADIFQQSAFGKVIQDRQAMMGLLGMIDQRDKYNQVKQAVAAENGQELERSFATVAATSSFKSEQVSNDVAFAGIGALQNSKGPLDKLLEKAHELAKAHEDLATAAYGAATVLGTIGAVGVTGAVLGGGKALAAGGSAGFLSKLLEQAKNVVRSPVKPGPVSWANLSKSTTLPAAAAQGGGALSMLKSVGTGAALFSGLDYVAPPAALNKPGQSPMEFAGSLLFSKLGLDLADVINTVKGGDEMNIAALREFVNRLDVISQRPVQVSVALDGQQIAASVNTSNAQQSRRN